MKLELIAQSLDVMFPDQRVKIAIDFANPEMGTTEISLGEYVRTADDFPPAPSVPSGETK